MRLSSSLDLGKGMNGVYLSKIVILILLALHAPLSNSQGRESDQLFNAWLDHGCTLTRSDLKDQVAEKLLAQADKVSQNEKSQLHLLRMILESEETGYSQSDDGNLLNEKQLLMLEENDRQLVKAKYFENQRWNAAKAECIYRDLAKESYPGAKRELGILQLKRGSYSSANVLLKHEYDKSFDARTALHAAKAAYMSGDFKSARTIFLKLLEAWPKCDSARRDYIYMLAVNNEYSELAQFLERTLERRQPAQDSDLFYEWAYLGYALGHTGELKRALEIYNALDYPPGYGWINAKLGNTDAAKKAIKLLLESRMQESIWRHWDVSYIYQELGDKDKAKEWLYKMANALQESKPQEYQEWLWRLQNEKDFALFVEDKDFWRKIVDLPALSYVNALPN